MNPSRIFLLTLTIRVSSCQKEVGRLYLFNGNDLISWDTYLGLLQSVLEVHCLEKNEQGEYTEAMDLDNDPLQIFSVEEQDGEQVIRISGNVWGALISKEEYENYHLHPEFKWGEQKHPPREHLPRNSGLCYLSVATNLLN
jgi:hypothetical protein